MSRLFRAHLALCVVVAFLAVLGSALTIAAAFLLERILDAVVQGDWGEFTRMAWVVLAYAVAIAVVGIAGAVTEKRLIVLVIRRLRADLHRGILARDPEQYRQVNSADYLSALTNDVKLVEENAVRPVLQVVQYLLVFLMAAAALFWYNPVIGGLMIASLLLTYLLPALLGRAIGVRQEGYSKGLALFTVRLKDQLAGYDVVRAFRLSDQMKRSFAAENNSLMDKKYAVDRLIAGTEGLAGVLGAGSQLGVMLFAGYLVLSGHMTAGALLAILQLAGAFVQPVAVIMQNLPLIQGAKPVLDRLAQLSSPGDSAFQGTAEPRFDSDIRFEGVSFAYVPGTPVLRNLDVRLDKGRKYALVGGSGCGKSTLISLLCAEYGTYTGAIRVDGRELHEVDIDRVLSLISVIHQDVYMFDETIGRNIDLHRTYPPERWQHALDTSGVSRFLGHTSDGLDTPVGEDGANLSGGQRQRIAVARALIEDKPILVLDEGTSAVDAQTAYDIETALLGVSGLTMVTITHNLMPDLLRRYDAVLYMEDGHVAEAGAYDALISQNGRFAAFTRIADREEHSASSLDGRPLSNTFASPGSSAERELRDAVPPAQLRLE